MTNCGQLEGEFIDLEDAFNEGFISRDDLLNIAYYYNHKVNVNDEDFVLKEINKEDLNEDVFFAIKETHTEKLKRFIESEPAFEDIYVGAFYGNYENCYCISVFYEGIAFDMMFIEEYTIGEVKLLDFATGWGPGIEIWRRTN